MESKIRIRVGEVEVEYEGSESFLKGELLNILKKVSELHEGNGGRASPGPAKHGAGDTAAARLSTASIASKLACRGGQDLVLAAGAHLTFSQNAETFTRQQVLAEIKSARAYYKRSYSNNLTKYLDALVRSGRLNEPSAGTYSLAADARKDIEARLAG